jgi:hypothetical protein
MGVSHERKMNNKQFSLKAYITLHRGRRKMGVGE